MAARAAAGKPRAKGHQHAADESDDPTEHEPVAEAVAPHRVQPFVTKFSARPCRNKSAEDRGDDKEEAPVGARRVVFVIRQRLGVAAGEELAKKTCERRIERRGADWLVGEIERQPREYAEPRADEVRRPCAAVIVSCVDAEIGEQFRRITPPSPPSIGNFAFFQACQLPGMLHTHRKPSCFKMLVPMLAR